MINDSVQFEDMAHLLKIISNPQRLKILKILEETERFSVAEIRKKIEIEPSSLSHHLTKMKENGILSAYKSGKTNYYQSELKEAINVLDNLTTVWKDRK